MAIRYPVPMQTPDLNLLVALDVLLEECSVSSAALRMNLSAPAMSRTLTRIREQFGDPILVRSGRNLVPTTRALELREQVRGVVEQARRVFMPGELADLQTLERTFSLQANDVFVGSFGGQLRAMLAAHAPRCALRIVPEGDTDDDALREGRIDLYISARRRFAPDTKVQTLFSTSFVGLAREGHPIFDQPIDPQRFVAFEHISVSRRGRARGPIDTVLTGLGLKRRVSYITPTFHSAIFALAGSDLILPSMPGEMLFTLQPLGLKLRPFDLPLSLPAVEIVQAWHPRLDNDPVHRWFRRMLKSICQHAGA